MDDPDTIPSRLHEVDLRPRPIEAEHPSGSGRLLFGVLVAVVLAAGWLVLGR